MTSLTANAAPAPNRYPGWAAVFQRGGPTASRVSLTLSAAEPGAYGENPRVRYVLSACGPRPFDGILLTGGDARLKGAIIRGPSELTVGGTQPKRQRPLSVPDLKIHSHALGASYSLGQVDAVRVRLPASPCRIPFRPNDRTQVFVGPAVVVEGRLRSPVHRASYSPMGFRAVRQTHEWPSVGVLPLTADNNLGLFEFGGKLVGRWSRPARAYFRVTVGALNTKASVDFSRPAVSKDGSLEWSESRPFTPTARLTNADNAAFWQSLLLGASIWFALGGSVLAALTYDALKSPSAVPASRSETGTATRRRASPLELFFALVVVFLLRRRR